MTKIVFTTTNYAVGDRRFYIIWCPTAYGPPASVFSSLKDAEEVAESMALRHGERFYVMEAVSFMERPTALKTVMKSYDLDKDREPF